jgi:hypothetical protein
MARQVLIPANWAMRIPGSQGLIQDGIWDGNSPLSINVGDANSHRQAVGKIAQDYGIPAAAIQAATGDSQSGGVQYDLIKDYTTVARGSNVFNEGKFQTGNTQEETSGRSATNAITNLEEQGPFTFTPQTFVTPAFGDESGAGGEGGASLAFGLFKPEDFNAPGAWQLGKSGGGYAVYGKNPMTDTPTVTPVENFMDADGYFSVNALLEGVTGADAVYTDAAGVQQINPWIQQLLIMADLQNGRISESQIAQVEAQGRSEVAQIQADAQIQVAIQQGANARTVEALRAEAEKIIATTQAEANKAIAEAQAGAASPFGFMQQGGTQEQLESIYQAMNQPANIAAQNNIFSYAAANPDTPLNEIAQLAANSPEAMAARGQEQAAKIRAEADQAIARVQSNVGLDSNQKQLAIAQLESNAARAIAAIQSAGQQSVAATQANPFGLTPAQYTNLQESLARGGLTVDEQLALEGLQARGGLTGEQRLAEIQAQFNPFNQTAENIQQLQETQYNPFGFSNQQGFDIAAANAANNPFAATQLGQDAGRIDQILRGGLTAEEQRQLALANQAGQMQSNFLNFIGNPYAVGAARTFSGGNAPLFNQQQLQQISDSPAGMVPAFTTGLNESPFALPETQPIGGARGLEENFTQGQFEDLSKTEQGSVMGQLSGYGITPDEIEKRSGSFTPGTTQYSSSYA